MNFKAKGTLNFKHNLFPSFNTLANLEKKRCAEINKNASIFHGFLLYMFAVQVSFSLGHLIKKGSCGTRKIQRPQRSLSCFTI